MTQGEKPAAVIKWPKVQRNSDICTFSEVVDKACNRLQDQQIKYTIRRIQEMESCLSVLEQELDEFLAGAAPAGRRKKPYLLPQRSFQHGREQE